MTSRAVLYEAGIAREGPSLDRVFPGESEMSALMRAFDWAKIDMGPPATWPPSLRFAVGLCLTSETPMALWWGPSLVMLYNDAYISFLGRLKHPVALGRPCSEVLPELWPALGPMIEMVRTTGNAVCSEDSLVLFDRAIPRDQEVCVSLAFNPIHGAGDAVDGIFCICTPSAVKRLELGAANAATPEPKSVEKKIRGYQEQLRDMAFQAVVAEERERRRIAADLHDGVGQSLSLAQIKLTSVRAEIAGAPREIIDDVIELLDESITCTRTLTFDLSPPLLYDLGIKDALSWLAEKLEKRHGTRIELTDDNEEKPLDEVTAGIVFRAARELLTNVLKHARTPSVSVALRRAGRLFELVVEDSGCGFEPEDLNARSPGFGLFSVREQIARLGGSMNIVSAPNRGARIQMQVPIRASEPASLPAEVKS